MVFFECREYTCMTVNARMTLPPLFRAKKHHQDCKIVVEGWEHCEGCWVYSSGHVVGSWIPCQKACNALYRGRGVSWGVYFAWEFFESFDCFLNAF